MTFGNTFTLALCEYIAQSYQRRTGEQALVQPQYISNIDVRWDSGACSDPTFPRDNVPPTLEVKVSWWNDLTRSVVTTQVDPSWALEALMRNAAGMAMS